MKAWVRGQPVEHPTESIRLFALCQAMKWSHLPVAGGIYDQHPKLIDEWEIIFSEKAEWEEQEHRRREAESKSKRR